MSGIDQKKVDEVAGDKYFAREKGDKKKGEEQFFKQGEKPEVSDIKDSTGSITNSIDRPRSHQAAVPQTKRQSTRLSSQQSRRKSSSPATSPVPSAYARVIGHTRWYGRRLDSLGVDQWSGTHFEQVACIDLKGIGRNCEGALYSDLQ